jgi:hypothetical protein
MNTRNSNRNSNAETTITDRCVQSCKKLLAGIERTKKSIAAEFREIVESNQKSFQLALNEAEALAWQTEFPQLFFPDLAVEKIQAVAMWQTRQQSVHQPQLAFARAA